MLVEIQRNSNGNDRSPGLKCFQLLVGPTFVKSHDQLKGAGYGNKAITDQMCQAIVGKLVYNPV